MVDSCRLYRNYLTAGIVTLILLLVCVNISGGNMADLEEIVTRGERLEYIKERHCNSHS